jgi:uncharacterized protein (DUF3084 family)
VSTDPAQPVAAGPLDQLYSGLAAAHAQGEDHLAAIEQAVPKLQAKQQELQQRRADADDDSQEARQLDTELDQLNEALAAAHDQLDSED